MELYKNSHGAYEFKIVVVGSGTVGKTSLLRVLNGEPFYQEHIPTIFENTQTPFELCGIKFLIDYWDTAGQENFDRLRPLSYKDVDCFILMYSCDQRASFDQITIQWIPELTRYSEAPIVLVASKYDLRESTPLDLLVDLSEAFRVQEEHPIIKAVIENSSKSMHNIQETLEACLCVAITDPPFLIFTIPDQQSPLRKGCLVHVYHKNKMHLAEIKYICKEYIKVYFVKTPFWFGNTMKITKRDDIEPLPVFLMLDWIFSSFRPFGLELIPTILQEIAQFLPENKSFYNNRRAKLAS